MVSLVFPGELALQIIGHCCPSGWQWQVTLGVRPCAALLL